MDLRNKTVLTGIQATGTPHIGNYVGAIRPAIALGRQVNQTGGTHVMFIADYHAINAMKDPSLLRQATHAIACTYLACGLDASRSLFYRQSDIPAIFELTLILMAFTPKGFMNKAHAYKAAQDKNAAKGEPPDAGVNMGLYTYPALMAADILAYDTDFVPVGKDQVQHVEITADIAGIINAHYGRAVLKVPASIVQENAQLLPGTDGRKMSKSYHNIIPLFADEETLKKAVMSIKTDSQDISAPKNPDDILLYQIMRGFASEAAAAEVKEGLEKGGLGYGTIKKMLIQAILDETREMREKYAYFTAHPAEVKELLQAGAALARKRSEVVLERIKNTLFGAV